MRETHIIPLVDYEKGDDKFLIYRPLQAIAFIGNRAMADIVREIGDLNESEYSPCGARKDALNFLHEVGFFRSDVAPGKSDHAITTAVLLLTNRCQLRCTYCYAAAGDLSPKVLKLDTARAVIDYAYARAAEQGKPGYRLEFHGGGEPTLEWDVLTESLEYARSKPLKADISITSNAVWSEEQCEWLIQHMDGMSISMDGDEITQNANRPLASGKPSFPIVMRNLRRLDEAGFHYGIRMTAVEPWERLAENIEFFATSTACRRIQVEPAFHPSRGSHGAGSQEDVQGFIDAFQAAYLVAKEHQVHFRYSSARTGIITRRVCTAPYEALVVNPDDQLVACYEVTNLNHSLGELSDFGCVKDGKVYINHANRRHLHDLIEERRQRCLDCFCRWSCAGDCYVRAFHPGENGHLVFGDRCKMNRELTIFLLLQLIADHGGVWSGLKTIIEEEDSRYG